MATPHAIPTHRRFQDLTGRRFGKLLVVFYAGPDRGHQLWQCRCDCGKESVARTNNLANGHTTSCGCVHEAMIKNGECRATHRKSHSPEWATYYSMLDRCYDVTCKAYKNYGGRGIAVCERWRESFENFLADMGSRPSAKHSIDRIDNDGDYCPENCRWATKKEQSANQRRSRRITAFGETLTLAQWGERLAGDGNRGGDTIGMRIKHGWTLEDAVSVPIRKCVR